MDASNKWTLKVEEARAELIAIKRNYHGNLTEIPYQRVTAVPTILFHAKAIEESYQDLSFILPNKKDKGLDENKWSQIPRIRTMICNYNYLLELWKQRNHLNEGVKNMILQNYGDRAYAALSLSDAVAAAREANMVKLIDLNERVLGLTDDLIIELDDFLAGFPKYVKRKIKTKKLMRYGSILSYSNNGNQLLEDIIKRSPTADYSSIEPLFGESAEQINQRHSTGYEQ